MKRRTFLAQAPAATAAAAATTIAGTADDSLINMKRFRSSLRRLFQNDWMQVLGELFQNSQRAGARHVTIVTHESMLIYHDDGHGIVGGADGFATMLRLADSYFDNRTIEDQDPMGLGLHALLAHEDVESVVFESGGLGTAVDCRRWWDDPGYYGSWRTRVQPSGVTQGFAITVRTRPLQEGSNLSPVERLRALLIGESRPQAGYGDYLAITLDGKALDTALPCSHRIEKPFLVTEYQGNRLLIGLAESPNYYTYRKSSINWYGQDIQGPQMGVRYRLEVRTGRPLNPRSPCREGIIDDDVWKKFQSFVADAVFKYVCDPGNRPKITSDQVRVLHSLDHARAVRECPYYLVRTIGGWDIGDSAAADHDDLGKSRFLAYTDSDQPTLVAYEIEVHRDGKETASYEHGRGVFLQELGDPDVTYATLDRGDKGRLRVLDIHWRPGGEHDVKGEYCSTDFRARGEWALTTGDEPPVWRPVTADVVVYGSGSADVTSADGVVGCADVVTWLRSNQVGLLFDYNDENGTCERQQEEFGRSVTDFICQLVDNTLPDNIALDLLIRKLDKKGAFSSITFGDRHLIVWYKDGHQERWELI